MPTAIPTSSNARLTIDFITLQQCDILSHCAFIPLAAYVHTPSARIAQWQPSPESQPAADRVASNQLGRRYRKSDRNRFGNYKFGSRGDGGWQADRHHQQ